MGQFDDVAERRKREKQDKESATASRYDETVSALQQVAKGLANSAAQTQKLGIIKVSVVQDADDLEEWESLKTAEIITPETARFATLDPALQDEARDVLFRVTKMKPISWSTVQNLTAEEQDAEKARFEGIYAADDAGKATALDAIKAITGLSDPLIR